MADRALRLIEAAAALAVLQPDGARERAPVGGGPVQPMARVMLDLPNRTLMHSIAARHVLAGVIRAPGPRGLRATLGRRPPGPHRRDSRIAEDWLRFDAKLTKIDMPTPPRIPRGTNPGVGPPIYPTWLFHHDISHLRRVMTPSFCMDITGYEVPSSDRSRRIARSLARGMIVPLIRRPSLRAIPSVAMRDPTGH